MHAFDLAHTFVASNRLFSIPVCEVFKLIKPPHSPFLIQIYFSIMRRLQSLYYTLIANKMAHEKRDSIEVYFDGVTVMAVGKFKAFYTMRNSIFRIKS